MDGIKVRNKSLRRDTMEEKKLYALVYWNGDDALYESVDEAVASRIDMDTAETVLLVQVMAVVEMPKPPHRLGALPIITAPASE